MKRIIRISIITLVAVVGLLGLGLLAINLYIQSPGIQLKIRNAVSENIGLPIDVFRISFTPWDGLVFQNVTIQNPSVNIPLLHADRLKIQCNYFGVFHRHVDITQVALQRVDINLPIRSESNNDLSSGGSGNPSPPSAANNAPSSPKALESPSPPASAPHAAKFKRYLSFRNPLPHHFWLQIQKFKIRDGAVYLLQEDNTPAVALKNVDCGLHVEEKNYVGKIRAEAAAIGESLTLTDIESPVLCTPKTLELAKVHATLGGGELSGNFFVDLEKQGYPFQLTLDMLGVHLNDVARESAFFNRAHGILEGSLKLTGSMSDPSQTQGQGNLEAKTAFVDQSPMLQELGRWTQIEELQRLHLDQAASSFRVTGPNIAVDSVRLISKNCQVLLQGTLNDDQHLNLKGRLTVSQFLSAKIPNELEDNFSTSEDGKTHFLDFQVSGSLQQPQTDLFERIVGDKRKLLKRILGGDRHKGREKDRDDPPVHPTPTDS